MENIELAYMKYVHIQEIKEKQEIIGNLSVFILVEYIKFYQKENTKLENIMFLQYMSPKKELL